jgi:nucleoside-triphosphatase THEP1
MAGWSAVVGRARSNKYDFVKTLAQRLRASGLTVGGFAQPLVRRSDGEPFGWDLENLMTGQRVTLARPSDQPHLCSYAFDPTAFETAAGWLAGRADVVIAEGAGKLEAAGTGHWEAVSRLIADASAPHLVIGIRDTSLAAIALTLPDPEAHIQLPAAEAESLEFARAVAELAGARARGPSAADRPA